MFSRLESYKHHDPEPRINYPNFAWPVWQIVFQVGIHCFLANQLIRHPPCDSYGTCQEPKGRGLQQSRERTFVLLLYSNNIAAMQKYRKFDCRQPGDDWLGHVDSGGASASHRRRRGEVVSTGKLFFV